VAPEYRRHDMSDAAWELMEPLLPGRRGTWGGNARDNRLFVDAVFWVLRNDAPWRALPPDYGDWKNTHRRFCRWRDSGAWERLLEQIIDRPDFEWLMLGVSHFKAAPPARRTRSGNAKDSRNRCDLIPQYTWPWMRMVCRSERLLQKVLLLVAFRMTGTTKGAMRRG